MWLFVLVLGTILEGWLISLSAVPFLVLLPRTRAQILRDCEWSDCVRAVSDDFVNCDVGFRFYLNSGLSVWMRFETRIFRVSSGCVEFYLGPHVAV